MWRSEDSTGESTFSLRFVDMGRLLSVDSYIPGWPAFQGNSLVLTSHPTPCLGVGVLRLDICFVVVVVVF